MVINLAVVVVQWWKKHDSAPADWTNPVPVKGKRKKEEGRKRLQGQTHTQAKEADTFDTVMTQYSGREGKNRKGINIEELGKRRKKQPTTDFAH